MDAWVRLYNDAGGVVGRRSGRFDASGGDTSRHAWREGVVRVDVICGRVCLAGQDVEIVCDQNLLQIHHHGVLVVTHARRHEPAKRAKAPVRAPKGGRRQRSTASVVSVTRKVDSHSNVCFADENYYAGTKHKRRQVKVLGGIATRLTADAAVRHGPKVTNAADTSLQTEFCLCLLGFGRW